MTTFNTSVLSPQRKASPCLFMGFNVKQNKLIETKVILCFFTNKPKLGDFRHFPSKDKETSLSLKIIP